MRHRVHGALARHRADGPAHVPRSGSVGRRAARRPGVVAVGSDTETFEVQPAPDPGAPSNPRPVHTRLLVERGICLLESLNPVSGLIAARSGATELVLALRQRVGRRPRRTRDATAITSRHSPTDTSAKLRVPGDSGIVHQRVDPAERSDDREDRRRAGDGVPSAGALAAMLDQVTRARGVWLVRKSPSDTRSSQRISLARRSSAFCAGACATPRAARPVVPHRTNRPSSAPATAIPTTTAPVSTARSRSRCAGVPTNSPRSASTR